MVSDKAGNASFGVLLRGSRQHGSERQTRRGDGPDDKSTKKKSFAVGSFSGL